MPFMRAAESESALLIKTKLNKIIITFDNLIIIVPNYFQMGLNYHPFLDYYLLQDSIYQ